MSLNWPDENYAKLYTRDTPNWLMMPWQARALLPLMIRKADGAGFIATGDRELDALALVVMLPRDVVAAGLEALLDLGSVVRVGGGLELPNFVDAQSARKTEAQKKRSQRDTVRALRRAETRETADEPVPTVSPDGPHGVPRVSPFSSAKPDPKPHPDPQPKPQPKPKKGAAQTELIAPPPAAPKAPSRIGKLHASFLELREARYTLPAPEGLELGPVPADEPPDWGRSAGALAQWLKRWPDDSEEQQDQRIEAVMLEWLDTPYWASPKPNKHTGKSIPFPWGAFCDEEQFDKACRKVFPEEAAA
jgi:hypothetical protein